MSSVSDSSLLTAAQEIVTDFIDNQVSLNTGVIKKAGDLGLNTDQTQRLIERTNTEAFLRVYPGETDFEVASPEVILGVKTSSVLPKANDVKVEASTTGLFKAASVESSLPRISTVSRFSKSFQEKLAAVSADDIFGIDEDFKKTASDTAYAPAIDADSREMCRIICDMEKNASDVGVAAMKAELDQETALTDMYRIVKQASLSEDKSLAEAEYECLNMFPEQQPAIREIFNQFTEKLASEYVDPDLLGRSEDVWNTKIAASSDVTEACKRVLQAYGAEIGD